MRALTLAFLVGALLSVAGAPATAQEPPLPADAVARVGEEPIARSQFDRWLAIARAQAGAPLDPPSFKRCIAHQRRRLEERPRRRALRRRCRRMYEAARAEVMRFLLQASWIRQEAAARGIAVAPERVRRSLERQKKAAFDSERSYRRFLRQSRMTEADLLFRVELDLLQQRVIAQATAPIEPVTEEEVDRYYARHRSRYRGVPRRRARRAIRRLLSARRAQRAVDRFIVDLRSRYRPITVCAEGYVVAECSNGSRSALGEARVQQLRPVLRRVA